MADTGTGNTAFNDPAAGLVAADIETFIRGNTAPLHTPLVPEIGLLLACDPVGIFQAAETFERPGLRLPPFWAYAWPGGQALARHLLDHGDDVRGRRFVDIGAGSGIASIAAAMAGAASVLAADIDPLAAVAAALNAERNGASVQITTRDLLSAAVDADVVLIGDLVYEPELATRVAGFLEAMTRSGASVLMADRTTARRPPLAFDLVADYPAPVAPELPGSPFERARVWQLRPTRETNRRRKT